jgi:NAD(P) transhydrogenase subunit alpha
MSQAPSKFKVFGLVLLAMLIGGLLFAQDDDKAKADKPSPSDQKKAVVETPAKEEAAPAEVATPKAKPMPAAPLVESKPSSEAAVANWRRVIASLTVFVLAVFVGFEVITKVPPTLHTPLMSGSNAISGITLVGAVIVAASMSFSGFVGFLAVALATVNAVGGFLVTHRMLAMFKKR